MKEFSVIMPCWLVNEELIQLTKEAIDSLGDVNLIIIDNGSPMGGGYLRSVADVYIRNKENLGYAKAVNQGLVLARMGQYIAIANDDIRVSPNWKEVTKEVLKEEDTYSCHFRMIPYDEPMKFGDKTWYTGRERWCSSSFFVLNKDQQYFLYDENFLNSYDDYDYWLRVRKAGLHTAYTTKACYQHKDSFTQKLRADRSENDKRNIEYFKQKWGGYPDAMLQEEFPDQFTRDWRLGFNEL